MRLLWKEASRFLGTISALEVKKPSWRCASCASEGGATGAVWTSPFALSRIHQRIVKEKKKKEKKVLNLRDSTWRGLFQCQRSSASGRWCLYNSKDTSVTTSRWQDAHVALYFAQMQGRAVSLCLHYLQGYQSMCWGDLSAAHHQSQAPLPVPPERAIGSLWSFDRPLISLHLPGLGTSAQTGKQPWGKFCTNPSHLIRGPLRLLSLRAGTTEERQTKRRKTLAVQSSFRHLAWLVVLDGTLVGGWRAIKIHL